MIDPSEKYPSFSKEGTYTVADCVTEDEDGTLTFLVKYKSDVHDMTVPVKARTQKEALARCQEWVQANFLRGKK